MAKEENKIIRRRLRNAYASSIISISLVLLLIGVAALLIVNARSVSDYFKENLQLSVILKQDATTGRRLQKIHRDHAFHQGHAAGYKGRRHGGAQ